MKFTLDRQCFAKNSYTEFYENPLNCLLADTTSRTVGSGLHMSVSFHFVNHALESNSTVFILLSLPVYDNIQTRHNHADNWISLHFLEYIVTPLNHKQTISFTYHHQSRDQTLSKMMVQHLSCVTTAPFQILNQFDIPIHLHVNQHAGNILLRSVGVPIKRWPDRVRFKVNCHSVKWHIAVTLALMEDRHSSSWSSEGMKYAARGPRSARDLPVHFLAALTLLF